MNPPRFLRREPSVANIESGVREILAKLKANANTEVCEVLAGATNVFSSAIIRFRGNAAFTAADIDGLLTVWQILLDVGKPQVDDYTPALKSGPGSGQPDTDGEDDDVR